MKFSYEVNEKNLRFLETGLTGKMRDAVSLGVRDSLAVIERKHKVDLIVRGQAKDPATFPDKLVWRTGGLAKSYQMAWKPGALVGAYESTLRRASVLEFGAIIRAKNAPYLHFQVGESWVRVKQVEIKGRFMMEQVEKDEGTHKKIDKIMGDAFEKGIDDAG